MARYRLRLADLADALEEMGLALPHPPGPSATVILELVDAAPTYADVRAEPLRAPLVEMVERGLSNRAIAAELNDRGEFGPNGGLWHSSSIKRLRARLGV